MYLLVILCISILLNIPGVYKFKERICILAYKSLYEMTEKYYQLLFDTNNSISYLKISDSDINFVIFRDVIHLSYFWNKRGSHLADIKF